MPFIGKNPTSGFSTIVKDDLTPDGSTTAFTLSKNVASANDIAVFVGNVRQEPTDAYSVSGTTLTMTAAPASGLNFYVLHIAGTLESSVVPADNTISTAKIQSSAITDAKIASGISSSKLTGALPAIDGSALTGISQDMVLISTQTEPTAATSFTVSLDTTGTYAEQIIVFAGWYQINLVDTYLRVIESGSAVTGASDYQYITSGYNNAATSSFGIFGDNSSSFVRTNWYATGDSSNETNDLIVHVRNAETSTQRTMITGTHSGLAGNGNMTHNFFVGRRASTSVSTGIQLLSNNSGSNYVFSNGGYIKHYGVK